MIDMLVPMPSIEAELARAGGEVRPLTDAEVAAAQPVVEEILRYIQNGWPVRTGFSRDAWAAELDADAIALRLYNDADYAEYVHYAGDREPLVDELVSLALEVYGPTLTETLRAAVRLTEATPSSPILAPVLPLLRLPALSPVGV